MQITNVTTYNTSDTTEVSEGRLQIAITGLLICEFEWTPLGATTAIKIFLSNEQMDKSILQPEELEIHFHESYLLHKVYLQAE